MVDAARAIGGTRSARTCGTPATTALTSAASASTPSRKTRSPSVGISDRSTRAGSNTSAMTKRPADATSTPTLLRIPPAATAELRSTPTFWR